MQRNFRRSRQRSRWSGLAWVVSIGLGACAPADGVDPSAEVDEIDEVDSPGPVTTPRPDARLAPDTAPDRAGDSAPDATSATMADASGPSEDAGEAADAGGASDTTSAAATDGGPAPGSRPSAACGRGLMPRTGTRSVTVAGKNRQFVLRVPEGYTGAKPLPVLFFLHGCNQNGPTAETTHARGFRNALGPHAVLLYPSADGNCWRRDAADLSFFDEMLKTVRSELCVDENRVFVTGISSGGYFSNDVGCKRGDVLRGLIPVAPGPATSWNGCKGPVDTMIIHSPRDSVVPFSRGLQVRDHWRGANGCTDKTGPGADAICESHQGCKPGYGLQLCRHMDSFYQNTFHGWPLIANRLILDFIQRRP